MAANDFEAALSHFVFLADDKGDQCGTVDSIVVFATGKEAGVTNEGGTIGDPNETSRFERESSILDCEKGIRACREIGARLVCQGKPGRSLVVGGCAHCSDLSSR